MALNLISEYKVNNEKIFFEKRQALQVKDELQARSSSLESVAVKACKTVHELHISEDA